MNKMLQSSLLFTKPIKKIPNNIIYKPSYSPDEYLMCNKNGEYVGSMVASVRERFHSSYYRGDLPYKSFHIYSLDILDKYRGNGYGSDFVEFAKKESYKKGCAGKVSLVSYFPDRAPHLFYYKKGFITPCKEINDYFNKCLKDGYFFSDFPAQDMFLPLKKEHFVLGSAKSNKNLPTIVRKILLCIKKFFIH